MTNTVDNAKYLSQKLIDTGLFETLNPSQMLPVVAVKLKDDSKYSVFDLSEELRKRGWITPAYTLPPDAQDIALLRMVVKENFSRDMAEILVSDVIDSGRNLDKKTENQQGRKPESMEFVK